MIYLYILNIIQIFAIIYLKNKIKYLLSNNDKITAIIAADEKLQQLIDNSHKQLKEPNNIFPFSFEELEILREKALEKSKSLQNQENSFNWSNQKGAILPKSVVRLGDPKYNDLFIVMPNNMVWRIYSSSSSTLEKYKGFEDTHKIRVILDAYFVDDLINKIRNEKYKDDISL